MKAGTNWQFIFVCITFGVYPYLLSLLLMTAHTPQPEIKASWLRCLVFIGIWFISLIFFSIPGLIFFGIIGSSAVPNMGTLQANPYYLLVTQLSSVLAVLFAVYIMRKTIEREAVAFPWLRIDLKGFLQGSLLAFALISISTAILSISGLVEFSLQSLSRDLLTYLGLFILVALHEEILTRGYLLDTLHKAYGKFTGILASTLVFTGLHIFNEHIGWIGLSNIFLSGVLMALFFLQKKNLWAAIGIHFAWNYAQGPIFGFAVSGLEVRSLLEVEHLGSSMLTGSEFGLEGSLIAMLVLAAAVLSVIALQYRKKDMLSGADKQVAEMPL